MRAMFGLVSLLVTIGVIVMIMHYYTLPAVQQQTQIKKQVEEKFESNTPSVKSARALPVAAPLNVTLRVFVKALFRVKSTLYIS